MKQEAHSLAIYLGLILRDLRIEAGLSQEDFAQVCGLHRTYIGAVERGEKNVTLVTALKITKALNIKLSQVIARLEEKVDANTD